MNTVIAWVMVVILGSGQWNIGPEFSTKEKCELASNVIQKSVDEVRWGMNIRKPICIRIEK